jgi:hypothetical protein
VSQWSERFRNHAAWQVMPALGATLDQAQSRDGIDAESLDAIARLRSVLTFSGKRLAGADAHVLYPPAVDQLAAALQAAASEVGNFVANGNSGHLGNANAQADGALAYLGQISVPLTTDDFIAVKESADAYRRGLESALGSVQGVAAQLRTELDATRASLAQLASEIGVERQRLTALVTEHQAQFSTAQDTRSREAAAQLKEQQEKFHSMVTEQTDIFTAKTTEFSTMLEAAQRQHAVKLMELSNTFVGDADKIRTELLNRKAEVEKLVGVIGNLGVTSGYQKAAKSARIATRAWQVITVLAMLGFIGIALYSFLPVLAGGFTWPGFAGRVFISFTVGVLAAYAASQADKYQKVERRNERMALELEAIGPFLAPLPQEKQEEFRLTIGDRSFGHDDANGTKADASPATLADVLTSKPLKDFIADVIKAAK